MTMEENNKKIYDLLKFFYIKGHYGSVKRKNYYEKEKKKNNKTKLKNYVV